MSARRVVARIGAVAVIVALAPVAAAMAQVPTGDARTETEPSLAPEVLKDLRESFGVGREEVGALDPRERKTLERWAAKLAATGLHAPEHSYHRRLFDRSRAAYLTDVLQRPALLATLPAFLAIQKALDLAAPVDTELEVALETLRRAAPVDDRTIALIGRLRGEGYAFTFPDLDLLHAAAARPSLEKALSAPLKLRRDLARELAERPHATRTTSSLPEGSAGLDQLSRVDALRISLVSRSLDAGDVRCRIARWIAGARSQGPETGGAVIWSNGDVKWRAIPSASRGEGRYRRPPQPRFPVELASFHLHATEDDDRAAAGPSLMDALSAAFDGRPRVVVTDLADGRFDVDYYRDAHAAGRAAAVEGRLKTVAVDLGIFEASDCPPGTPG